MAGTEKQQQTAIIQVIAGTMSVIGLVGLIYNLISQVYPVWLNAIYVLILLAYPVYFFYQPLIQFCGSWHPSLVNANFLLVLAILFINILILYHIWPASNILSIPFDHAKDAIFNSYQNQPKHTEYLNASGDDKFSWNIIDNGRTGSFKFKINTDQEPSPEASSGGYITFYGQPCDRLKYRTIRFRFRVTESIGNPDIGIRLAVDNPKATGDKELVTYEIESLAKYGQIKHEWQTFEIPISAFERKRYEPPFPENINENRINKMVFFVNTKIANRCLNLGSQNCEARFWITDISFQL